MVNLVPRRLSSSTSQHNNTNFIVHKCISLLQSCASSTSKLTQIHAFSIRRGVALSDADMAKHLIFAAVSLSAPMSYSHRVFSLVDRPNIFTWNTMIRGYAESHDPSPALDLYRRMQSSSVRPDTHSFPVLLKVVAKLTNASEGKKIHSVCVRIGFDSLVFVQNALLHMYAYCGRTDSAHQVFDSMHQRDLVAWNTVINGFALNGRPNEALELFRGMCSEGVGPDGFTVVSLLSACSELGALSLGRRVHVFMVKSGLTSNVTASNALLDLYAKCGSVKEAQRVFGETKEKTVVSWSSLVVGLAVNGFGREAIELFEELERKGFVPSDATFVGVLLACSHRGMVERGLGYFTDMREKYGIAPKIEHYGCIVDLLGRAGSVEKAFEFIQNMALKPNAVVWRTLLGACTVHGNSTLAEFAKTQLEKLDPKHSGNFVLLSNLYASESRWSKVQSLRSEMQSQGVWKTPGTSLVELRNRVFEFFTGDRSHLGSEETYAKLAEISNLLKLQGYVANTANVLADIEEEEKESALSYHSERIAVAFALVNTGPGVPIRIIKNLRVCVDCHVSLKLISKVYDREIVVRDCTRFHHFRNGSCSCGDYW